MSRSLTQSFVRDRFTWLAYFALAYYAYTQATLGPLVPFLRDELKINYTIAGLHLSAYALGMFGAGLTADRMVRRFGRLLLFWGGGAGMALGAVLLTLGRHPAVTIASTFFMALLGSNLLVMIQSTLADKHGELRAYALTESNVMAVIGASAAPIIIGFSESSGLNWRMALFISVAAWLLMAFTSRRVPLPESRQPEHHSHSPSRARLPRIFWAYWLVVFISVSIEWSMIFWAAEFMEKVAGLSKEAAATSVSLFFIAQVIGRAAGSWLTRHYATGKLLLLAGVIIIGGFPLFWLGRMPLVNALGLFLCGLGVANLYPLTLSLASAVGRANPDAASGYTSMGSGIAILVAPQLLGVLADQFGIQWAYSVVAPLSLAIIVVTWYANCQRD